ncbi:MAG: acyltransferase [Salibacteraceae bacterium]
MLAIFAILSIIRLNSETNLHLQSRILSLNAEDDFWPLANELFEYQSKTCIPFKQFLCNIGWRTRSVNASNVALLPVEAFKYDKVVSFTGEPEAQFMSSGTTGITRSTRYIQSIVWYNKVSKLIFESGFYPLEETVVLALLPSYIEAGDSSLVHMVQHFINQSNSPQSGFVPYNASSLRDRLDKAEKSGRKIILFGVSYALLDLVRAEKFDHSVVIIETGGMKGRGRELTRFELHERLQVGFPNGRISSEYGMTELISQAYLHSDGFFRPPPWMRVLVTDVSDPLSVLPPNRRGLLGIIDLAGYDACSFIQTRDIGLVKEDGAFTVEGRLDHSDLRGCNLLYTG